MVDRGKWDLHLLRGQEKKEGAPRVARGGREAAGEGTQRADMGVGVSGGHVAGDALRTAVGTRRPAAPGSA